MRRFCLAVAVLALPAPVLAQEAFTTDDLLRIEDLSDPVFTADGNHITYVVTGPGDGDAFQFDLWQAAWDGGDARPLFPTLDRDEWAPAWSKDGRVLAFLRSGGEDEAVQLWVSEADAPPRKVSDLPGGANSFALAPDGRSAVVVSEVGSRVLEDEPDVPAPIVMTRFIVREDGRGYIDDRRTHLFRIDLASGTAAAITSGDYDVDSPSFSPDGSQIAFVSRQCDPTGRARCSDVYVMPATGGEARRISKFAGEDADPGLGGGGPQWSPDSQSLVWTRAGDERAIYYTPQQLVVANIGAQTDRPVAWIDRWFYYPRWSPDDHLLALVEQDRDTWLAKVDPVSGHIDYLTQGARFATGFATSDDGRIAVVDGGVEAPPVLRAVEGRTLADHNAWLAGRRLAEVRDVSWQSDGVAIHGLLTLPIDYRPGDKPPLIVRVHGGPVYQYSHEFMADWQVYAAQGYAVLAPNPRGSSGRGQAFAEAQMANWGGPDVADVSAGISHVIDAGLVDPERIGIGGWSYGGILTNYMIVSDPRIRAAVSGAGMANFLGGYGLDQYARDYEIELGAPWAEPERWMRMSRAFFDAPRITAPTLYLCAEQDHNVPCAGSQQMYQALKSLGVPTRLVIYPGESHGLTTPSHIEDRMQRQLDWYGLYLTPKTTGD